MVAILPVAEATILSFSNWDGVKQLNTIEFVGIKNYVKVLKSNEFWFAIRNNLIWAVVGTIFPVGIGLIQATAIVNSGVKKKNLFQLLLFMPQILSSIIMSIMWLAIFDSASGLINGLLGAIGLKNLQMAWLGDKRTALICLLIVSIWAGYGFNTILYCTAMRSVDRGLYEAATIDGASKWELFIHVTIPCIRSTTNTLLLLSLIGAFKVFDTVFQMTKGGPGYHTYVISYYLYTTAFTNNKIGLGCAIAVIQSLIVLGVSKVFQGLVRER